MIFLPDDTPLKDGVRAIDILCSPIRFALCPPMHQMHRHGIEHFVAKHKTIKGFRQTLQPANSRHEMGKRLLQ